MFGAVFVARILKLAGMNSPRFIAALDQGTTSSRTVIYDHAGKMVAKAQQELPQYYPQSGWVEHDANEIWRTQEDTLRAAMAKAKIGAKDLAAVGITNQRETLVIWEKSSGEPVGRAIVWQDRRTADECARYEAEGLGGMVSQKTGLRLDPYFTGTKLAWALARDPELRRRAEQGEVLAGTVDSWLIWKLTAGKAHRTDASNASRTLLLNIDTGDWDDELLNVFDIPRQMLPDVSDSSGVLGTIAAGELARGVPIAGVAGDQQAALFGQGCFTSGMAKNTYGTGCFLLMQTGEQRVASDHGLLTTVAWRMNGKLNYALEGAVFVAGAAVQWARDELGLVRSAEELSELAASVPDANGAICVPAFTGLGAPHWDPYARGTFMGLTRGTTRAHFCRAILESIALQSQDLITAMEKDSKVGLRELRVDGGAAASDPLMQVQANLANTPVVRPVDLETTAMGAAHLAGLGVGFWSDMAELRSQTAVDRKFVPQPGLDPSRLRRDWQRALQRTAGWEKAD